MHRSIQALLTTLKSCSLRQDLQWGRRIHANAVECRNQSDMHVVTALVKMYASCGSMADAQRTFDSINMPDVVSWNVLLLGYAQNGDGSLALELFSRMKADGCAPTSATYVAVLKACTSGAGDTGNGECLERGRQIHLEAGPVTNFYVQNALIDMYAKCGSMVDARCVFDTIKEPNVVSWTALILGYAESGEGKLALELFSKMKACGCMPNPVTYTAVLKACASLAVEGLELGKRIHSEIGCPLNRCVQGALIDMYSKCGSMVDARWVFDSIHRPDVVSWTSLLLGYADNGEGLTALALFTRMKSAGGCPPNPVTFVAALRACMSLAKDECLKRGREIHSQIGSQMDRYVQNALIDMYAKRGSMVEARLVFDRIQNPEVVSWNALLGGYADNGDGFAVLELFTKMKARGTVPTSPSYIAALKACTSVHRLELGREMHSEIPGCYLDRYVQNALIDMYAKCGSMAEARCVLSSMKNPGTVSWNHLLLGYAEKGDAVAALDVFSAMKAGECSPNAVTYAAVLKSCATLSETRGTGYSLEQCRQIHSEIGCHLDHYLQNMLIDMYSKCGSMVEARRVFDDIQKPNVMCWTALILGYAENGDGRTGLELFSLMKARGCAPDSVTYVAALKACTSLAANGEVEECRERGREIHSETGSHLDHYVQCTLVDMYAKCGSMVESRRVFDGIGKPDVVTWNALFMGYADNGEAHTALDLFPVMKSRDCVPNSVTYVALLKSCGLLGDLAVGRELHTEIAEFTAHLVTCLVDCYAKCGSMLAAREVFDLQSGLRNLQTWNALLAGYGSFGDCDSVFAGFEAMRDEGFQPNAITFMSVLLCCSHAGLVEKARGYFETMLEQDRIPPAVTHYTCLIDVLARANRLNEAIALLRRMPCNPDLVIWKTLLGACTKWRNVGLGTMVFQSLVGMNKEDASAHVLMAETYGVSAATSR